MQYKLDTFVWELTMGCNLRCRHCGSSCGHSLQGELTTQESLAFVDQVAVLNPRWMSLSGGEPLLRKDWDTIVQALVAKGILVRMISNGTLLDEHQARRMRECQMDLVSVSTDGTQEYHDRIRGKGNFEKVERAFRNLKKAGVAYDTNTTILKENISNLHALKDILVKMGVQYWQIQPGLPEGNMENQKDMVVGPEEVAMLIDFAYEQNKKGDILVALPDTVGYYTRKETLARQAAQHTPEWPVWQGCSAGVRSFGLLHNGDVVGCTSMRDTSFVEGNVRQQSIADLWAANTSFAWRRGLKKEQLGKRCRSCQYGDICLGGCSTTRLTGNQTIYSDNPLCVYCHSC